MKFELVEFYPSTDETKKRRGDNCLGTVHIYCIDCELDIRGIAAKKAGRKVFFSFPHFIDFDEETGEEVRYPLVRFTNDKTQKEMMDFLKCEVSPIILEKIKSKGN